MMVDFFLFCASIFVLFCLGVAICYCLLLLAMWRKIREDEDNDEL